MEIQFKQYLSTIFRYMTPQNGFIIPEHYFGPLYHAYTRMKAIFNMRMGHARVWPQVTVVWATYSTPLGGLTILCRIFLIFNMNVVHYIMDCIGHTI
jgi:hypothetical protein